MKIKLYLDEDVFPVLAEVLRERGYDTISTKEAKMRGESDKKNLEFAIKNKRAIFTFNISDYVQLTKSYEKHYGIIVSPQRNFKEILRRLLVFLATHTAEEIKNKVYWL